MSHEQAQAAYQQGQFIIDRMVKLIDYIAELEARLAATEELLKGQLLTTNTLIDHVEAHDKSIELLEAENREIWEHWV